MGATIPIFFLMEAIPCFDFPFTAVFFAVSFHFLVRGFIQKRQETGSMTLWQPSDVKERCQILPDEKVSFGTINSSYDE
jgi:hypothetical protein